MRIRIKELMVYLLFLDNFAIGTISLLFNHQGSKAVLSWLGIIGGWSSTIGIIILCFCT